MLEITNNIEKIRTQRGLTQRVLAKLSKISQSHIANMERKRRAPSVYTLIALSDVLNVKVSDLIQITENDKLTTKKYF